MRARLLSVGISMALHALPVVVCPAWRVLEPGDGGAAPELRIVGLIELAGEPAPEPPPPEAREPAPDEPPPADLPIEEPDEDPEGVTVPVVAREEEPEPDPAEDAEEPEPEAPDSPVEPEPGAPVVSGDPRPSAGEVDDLRRRYLASVLRRVHEAKRYPARARWRGQEGRAVVLLTIDRSGGIASAELSRSTSFRLLDEEALGMVRRAAPFDPIPSELEKGHWTLRIPIRFDLSEIR